MIDRTGLRPHLALAVAIAFSALACANNADNSGDQQSAELAGAPGWVTQGCEGWTAGEEGSENICGVGSFAGSQNISLARTAAMARGRTEIARSLGVKVKSMLKDYQETTTGGEQFGTSSSDEQHIIDVSKQITDMSLTGTEVKDTWVSGSGTYYALVVLDLDRFEQSVNRMNRLDENVRKAVNERARSAFGEMNGEVESERNR